jgi:hypothetical protein
MSKTDNRPSHRVYAVTKNGERSFWQPRTTADGN